AVPGRSGQRPRRLDRRRRPAMHRGGGAGQQRIGVALEPPAASRIGRGGRLDGRPPPSVYWPTMRALPTIVAISLTALGLMACDKGIPTAPAGTTLVVTANPVTIPNQNGTSTITITALRSGGQPVNPGTEI